MTNKQPQQRYEIAIVGLGVMGGSLLLNMADHGCAVTGYGKDMVCLDALCCGLLGVKPQEVLHIKLADESGLGKMDLEGKVTRKTAAMAPGENSDVIPGRTV